MTTDFLCSEEVHLHGKIALFSLVKNKLKQTAVNSLVLLFVTVTSVITPNPQKWIQFTISDWRKRALTIVIPTSGKFHMQEFSILVC